MTISYTGGRWQVAFMVRYQLAARPVKRPRTKIGGAVGVDAGITHLATLSKPVPGLSDEHGHVPNPRPLATQLERLKALDRRIARCQRQSHNRARLKQRRARLHGRIAKTRKTVVGRFYASSKTCSDGGAVKAKLPLNLRTFDCDHCGTSIDRDVNAAHNIAREAVRLHEHQHLEDVAGLRPETENADPRPHKTRRATAPMAVAA